MCEPTLAPGPDNGQPDRAGHGGEAPGRVAVSPPALVDSTPSGTSVPPAESQGDPAWWDDYQQTWLRVTEVRRQLWDFRAGDTGRDANRRRYAEQRARALGMDQRARLDECGKRKAEIRCRCRTVVVDVGCGQRWTCAACRDRWARRLRRRLHRSAKVHFRKRNRGRRHQRYRWVMVTGTVRHSGDVAADLQRLKAAWRALYRWTHKRIGQFDYCQVHEVTQGRDGRGHVHFHAVVLWPWIDWHDVRAAWKRAIGDDGAELDMKACAKGVGGAAEYVTKYVSKGNQVTEMNAQLAARVVAAYYNKRTVTASLGFWHRPSKNCSACKSPYCMTKKPGSVRIALPWEVWRSIARRRAVPSNRVGWVAQTAFG